MQLYQIHREDPPLARNMPPIAGKVLWIRQLYRSIQEPIHYIEVGSNFTTWPVRFLLQFQKSTKNLIYWETTLTANTFYRKTQRSCRVQRERTWWECTTGLQLCLWSLSFSITEPGWGRSHSSNTVSSLSICLIWSEFIYFSHISQNMHIFPLLC